jgi:hypothetical protein
MSVVMVASDGWLHVNVNIMLKNWLVFACFQDFSLRKVIVTDVRMQKSRNILSTLIEACASNHDRISYFFFFVPHVNQSSLIAKIHLY